MVNSQNGWPALTSAPAYKLQWIIGRVLPGDVATIFEYLGKRFDGEVERISRDPKTGLPTDSWGWAYRDIRGATTLSNHASGTAVDFNATKHPLGKTGTFTAAQVKTIRAILADLGGVVRWGGDYTGRKDEMHFEINANAAKVALVAAKIRANENIVQTTQKALTSTNTQNSGVSSVNPSVTANNQQAKKIETIGALMKTLDLNKTVTPGITVRRLQALLTANGHPPTGGIDGNGGQHTKAALLAFQKVKKLTADGIAGAATWNALLGVN